MMNIDKIPVPQGKYLAAVRHESIVYTSGMTPRKAGKLLYSGKIKTDDVLESHRDALHLATLNALGAVQNCLKAAEKISVVLQMSVFLNAEENFTKHAKIADFASEFLIDFLGIKSVGTRAAIGVASLPSNATVEVTLVCKID